MSVFDGYMVDTSIDLLTKVKIQAQVLVPLVHRLRKELGDDKANALVRDTLRDWSARLFAEIGRGIDAAPKRSGRRCTRRWARSPPRR
jgi:hypothetical protein